MKLIVTNKNEFQETEVSVLSNNDVLILKKTVSETINQLLGDLPENFTADPFINKGTGEVDYYIIREMI